MKAAILRVTDSIWICKRCHLVFASPAVIHDHELLTGHRNIKKYDLPDAGSLRDAEHV